MVLLNDADEGPALKARVPWLSWGVVEGLNALPYHEWVALLTKTRPDFNPAGLVDRPHGSW